MDIKEALDNLKLAAKVVCDSYDQFDKLDEKIGELINFTSKFDSDCGWKCWDKEVEDDVHLSELLYRVLTLKKGPDHKKKFSGIVQSLINNPQVERSEIWLFKFDLKENECAPAKFWDNYGQFLRLDDGWDGFKEWYKKSEDDWSFQILRLSFDDVKNEDEIQTEVVDRLIK